MNEQEIKQKELEFNTLLVEKGIYDKIEGIKLKQKEAELELEKQKKKSENTLLQKGIFVALIGVFATLIGGLVDGCNSRKLEKDRLNSNLILKAIETKNPKESAKSLSFLISAGLLEGVNTDSIKKIINDPDYRNKIPSLLSELDDYQNSNLDLPFSVKGAFEFDIKKNEKEIVFEIQKGVISLLAKNIEEVYVSKIFFSIAEEKENGDWGIVMRSDPHMIKKNLKHGDKLDVKPFKAKITLNESDEIYKSDFIVIEIETNINGMQGKSNIFPEVEIPL